MSVAVKTATLPNGLTILGEVDPAAHTAAAGFFVRTGAPQARSVGDSRLSWDLALFADLSDDASVYAKVANAFRAPEFAKDPTDGSAFRPHRVNPKNGMYRGRQVLNVEV